MRNPDSPPAPAYTPPTVPGWAVPRGPGTSDVEAAFLAGAALNSFDNLVRAEPAWGGAWRQRLALRCTAAAMPLVGRSEDEAALRDAWHLRSDGADPGPAGTILAAWKRLANHSPGLTQESLRSTVALLGLRWSDELSSLIDRFEVVARSGAPAPLAAAALMADLATQRPDADLLGWWLADQMLARRLRWPVAVPLLVTQARGQAFRSLSDRGRVRPGGEGFERGVCLAFALAAADACRLASEIAPRATQLMAVAPKLRAKGAGEAIRLLLDDDAVPGTLQTATLTRWGSRRLFDRLTGLGAVRELSGRASFRLYGL